MINLKIDKKIIEEIPRKLTEDHVAFRGLGLLIGNISGNDYNVEEIYAPEKNPRKKENLEKAVEILISQGKTIIGIVEYGPLLQIGESQAAQIRRHSLSEKLNREIPTLLMNNKEYGIFSSYIK